MGRTCSEANKTSTDLLTHTMEKQHQWLLDEQVRVRFLMVDPPRDKSNMPTAPALQLAGHSCAGKIKLCNARERILSGGIDVVLEVDAPAWKNFDKKRREALLDHELTHVEPKRDAAGATLHDETGRALLFLKPDDYLVTGFYEVALRHEEMSLEVVSLGRLLVQGEIGQLVFDFCEKHPKAADTEEEAA